jgi:polyisoprenyl-teichoic acid--peptidoglycan teichoic acid transferase
VPPMINTAHPDIALVHDKVQAAIDRAEGRKPATDTAQASPGTSTDTSTDTSTEAPATGGGAAQGGGGSTTPTTPANPPSVTGGSLGSLSQGYAANQSEDLGAVC